ncbi:MAG: hypothetical protein JNK79_04855 [Chitinophagaceae bacterium]|nr:hypothetical protein [Chitinophagaceae bacterium]
MKTFLVVFALEFIISWAHGQSSGAHSNVSVQLYNPTGAELSSVIEIPTGSIASPGLINWNNVHFELSGKPVPFAIREGKAHWKAALSAPVRNPRPEDLLVFSLKVPPGTWSSLILADGPLKPASHITRRNENIFVVYDNMSVSLNERTGMLNSVSAFGDSLLSGPMRSQFFEAGDSVIEQHGSMNPGNNLPSISLKKGKYLPMSSVKLVSSFSNDAMTELNFLFQYKNDIAVALAYRIYPSGQLEIIFDERPWKDESPWLKYGLETSIQLNGAKKELDAFQSYFPYYGFKDYASSVKSTGECYEGNRSTVYVFGEESLNGRFWKRKLKVISNEKIKNEAEIINLLSEGVIVRARPVGQKLPSNVVIKHTPEDSVIAQTLAGGLESFRIDADRSSTANAGASFTIELTTDLKNERIPERDGFRIDPVTNGLRVSASSKFGLYKAVTGFLKHMSSGRAPLIASNPVVALRAGGFGGGPFEVDFPYGDEAEWRRAIDGMMTSGMNSMTDLGMWSNWKMPVSFKYMPELRSSHPDAYDEVSGARFSAFDSSREFAAKLIDYIHARGGKVWLWVPVGAIPNTFEEKFPEATVPGKSKVPRFMHPEYRRYLKSYFKELLETYPLDGFVLIRDDNGGIDETEEFKEYLAQTKTKDRVWEQYIVLHKLIRDLNFSGTIAVYPYFDLYKPAIEQFIPKDMVLVGHGTGFGPLSRNYETLGTMGDTWLDNLFTGFRVPSTEKMKRLLSDRGSYWIGGAYTNMELTWNAIGYFGWEPTASVNSFRYSFGAETFGDSAAMSFVHFSEASDNLWEIMNGPLFPFRWFSLAKGVRDSITKEARRFLVEYKQHLSALEKNADGNNVTRWIKQAQLYGTYFNYHLERANLSSQLEQLVLGHMNYHSMRSALPGTVRSEIISLNKKIYDLSEEYDRQMAATPGAMLAATRSSNLTKPFREFVYGYNGYGTTVDQQLAVKQFDATMKSTIGNVRPGERFDIRIDLKNTGFMPWMKEHEFEIRVGSGAKKFSMKDAGDLVQQPVVFGDTLSVVLQGVAPENHGSEEIIIELVTPFRQGRQAIAGLRVLLKW